MTENPTVCAACGKSLIGRKDTCLWYPGDGRSWSLHDRCAETFTPPKAAQS